MKTKRNERYERSGEPAQEMRDSPTNKKHCDRHGLFFSLIKWHPNKKKDREII